MTTKKRKVNQPASVPKKAAGSKEVALLMPSTAVPVEADPVSIQVEIDNIEVSPSNYRQYYDPEALQEFAAGVRAVGFTISPATVRQQPDGRYQIVAGMRRFLGAKLAGLTHLPCVIRDLTDDQVEEIQMQENVQREDPHPMHEAEGIRRMYKRKLTTEEIAVRLGKSVTWVYKREKLSRLIGDIQEMFLANVFTATQAFEIAALSADAQKSFFERHCNTWKETRPVFGSLTNYLAVYRYDLSEALFDLNDPTLSAEQGACYGCRFNSAYSGLLIPDEAGAGKCTLKTCFDLKRTTHLNRLVTNALTTEQCVAIITYGELPAEIKALVDTLPGAQDIPLYQEEKVTIIEQPEGPDKDDFTMEDYPQEYYDADPDDQEKGEWEEVTTLDQEGYDSALEEFQTEMAAYNVEITNGKSLKALYVCNEELKIVYYYPVAAGRRTELPQKKGKQNIQALIAAKQDTPELLQEEIDRITSREHRNKQLDKEKIQKSVHSELVQLTADENANLAPTDEDRIATRWLVYQTLTYRNKNQVEAYINVHVDYKSKPEELFAAIAKMSDSQFSYLVRMALAGLSGSDSPTSASGFFLKKVAQAAGVNTDAVEAKQTEVAQSRQDRQAVNIGLYKKRIKRHQSVLSQAA